MAIDFSVKEARQLINRHKELLSNLEYIEQKAASMQAAIKKSANDLITQPTLKRIILNDCLRQTESIQRNIEVEQLIYNLYKYQKSHSTIEVAKSFHRDISKSIRQDINLLRPGLAGLSWFFGGRRAKENAKQAYEKLTKLLNENYGHSVPHLFSDINTRVSADTAWDTFNADPYLFMDTLGEVYPEAIHAKGYSPFRSKLTQLKNLEQKISECKTVTDEERNQIKAAAEKMMAFNALQILRSVPVEEVNREKSGFRIKTLREAGLTTMADIYSSSLYQLSSFHGISETAAFSMKRIAKHFLEEAQESVKIKLSVDDRSNQATALIKTIYTYRQKNEAREALKNIVCKHQWTINHAKTILDSIKNGLPWLFYSKEQRATVRDAYLKIKDAVEGEYAQEISRLSDILQTHSTAPSANIVWKDFQEHNIEYISVLEDILPGSLGNDDSLYGLPEDLAREIQEEVLFPDGLLCTLRRYQEWGVKYILHQKKVLLGDEMGLGKTVQAIATMVSLRNTDATHFLVVCPASVVTNWCREVVKHSKLRVTKIHGTGRAQALKSWVKTGGVAVTTFETTAYIKNEEIEKINLLIVDEAHYIKNSQAHRSINVKRLCEKAERLLFMTGTALENNVDEMVSLIDVLQPRIAASAKSMTFMSSAPQFRNHIAPVYYRRKREDVLTELPELIETKEWCTLNPREKEIYEQNILLKNYVASRRLSWNIDDLKQSCKATRLMEIIEEAKAENRKVLVFSFFLDTIWAIGGLLGTQCYGPITGSVQPPRRQEIIDDFDKAPAGSVLLAQIQSGGTGLNIQSASVVVICEPQFKPSIENQAISRAYRMGQSRNVLVYRLLCTNTIDEKIMELLENKQAIFDAFADKSVAAEKNESNTVEIDEKKLGQLIQEEINRINAEKGISPKKDET